jgi:hypothetical protein
VYFLFPGDVIRRPTSSWAKRKKGSRLFFIGPGRYFCA